MHKSECRGNKRVDEKGEGDDSGVHKHVEDCELESLNNSKRYVTMDLTRLSNEARLSFITFRTAADRSVSTVKVLE